MKTIFRRIGLIGAIANPNFGDDLILYTALKKIDKMYGNNCKVYIFSKDASYTQDQFASLHMNIIAVDYIHRLSVKNNYQLDRMEEEGEAILTSDAASDNYQYSEIHKIFRQLDVLHILGGGISTLYGRICCMRYIFPVSLPKSMEQRFWRQGSASIHMICSMANTCIRSSTAANMLISETIVTR